MKNIFIKPHSLQYDSEKDGFDRVLLIPQCLNQIIQISGVIILLYWVTMKNCEFITKLVDMMQNNPRAISWEKDGSTLVIPDLQRLSEQVLPTYFRHGNTASFIRQLNMYGFKREQGAGKELRFRHEIFKAGNEAKFSEIRRKSKSRNLKNAEDVCVKERSEALTKLQAESRLSSHDKQVIFQLLLFKDERHRNLKQINKLISHLSSELQESRSRDVLYRISQIEKQDSNDLQKSLAQSRRIDRLISAYCERKPERLSDSLLEDCSLHEQMHESGEPAAGDMGAGDNSISSFQ